jgi:hypothetical protein
MPVLNPESISLGTGVVEMGDISNGAFAGYSDIGVIKGTVTVDIENEVLDFEAGRPLIVIVQQKIRERVMFRCTMAELNLATLKQAIGQGSISGSTPTFLDGSSSAYRGTLQTGKTAVGSSTILKFGGSPTHAYVGLRFTHARANGKRVIFEAYKASPTGRLQLPFNESDWNLQEFEMRLLADTDRAAGEQYFQFLIES